MRVRLAGRFRAAFWTSVLASFAAVALAIGPNLRGEYDANLAVLTATLVSIIWYTFFTYCALHRAEESRLQFEVERGQLNRMINVRITNPTRERRISFRVRLAGQRNGKALDMPAALSGDNVLTLPPGAEYETNFEVSAPKGVGSHGPAVQIDEPEFAVLRLDLKWRDDLGERGAIGPDFWALDLLACDVQRSIDDEASKREWQQLGGQDLAALAPLSRRGH